MTILLADNLQSLVGITLVLHITNAIQVTFDGIRERHDQKRIYPSGKGSYDLIMDNVETFIKQFPDITIKIRVNIDKTNSNDFLEIHDIFKRKYPSKKNIFVYPAALKACNLVGKNSPFLCNSDVAELYSNYIKQGIMVSYPNFSYMGCGANRLSSYVIGPQGELYKCWQDVGIPSKVIGNINSSKFSNDSLINKYLLHGSHMLQPECLDCPLLPICDSNCANDRLDNANGTGNHELCSIYKEQDYKILKEKLIALYKIVSQQNQPAA